MEAYQVVVGNVGTVWTGPRKDEAVRVYDEYVRLSKSAEGGRVAGEPVTLLAHGRTEREHPGDYRRSN